MQLCRLPKRQGVKSKKKKVSVSLLLIIRKRNKQRRCSSSPFLPPTSINILAVAQKEKGGRGGGGKKGKQFTHNYHSGVSRLPADVCLYYNGGWPPLTKIRCVSHNHNTARVHALRRARTGTCTCTGSPPIPTCWRELARSWGGVGKKIHWINMQLEALLCLGSDKRVVNPVA